MDFKKKYCASCKNFVSNISDLTSEDTKGHLNELFTIPSRLLSDYELKSMLGKGSFGIVFKATHKFEGDDRAIKLIQLQGATEKEVEDNTKDLLNEIRIIKKMKHEHIIEFDRSFNFADEKMVGIVTELADGSLADEMDQLSNEDCFHYLRQICLALDYVHKQNVIHRDLKPQNILLLGKNVKICDFGIAKITKKEKTTLTRIAGTPGYMAPEILDEEENIDCKVDIWSLGVIIHQMFARGALPLKKKGKIS